MTLFGVAIVVAMMAGTSPAFAMNDYKWKYRPLVVFADDASVAPLVKQRRMVTASRSGLGERDVVVVWVIGNTVSAELGPKPRASATSLRGRFGAPAGSFRAVLIGKDGGTKLNSASPLAASTLYGTIDGMPMRRNEMQRR